MDILNVGDVGDVVMATTKIKRTDGRSFLTRGEIAKITSVYHTDKSQIVGIEITGRLPMTDIVCHPDKSPLRKV